MVEDKNNEKKPVIEEATSKKEDTVVVETNDSKYWWSIMLKTVVVFLLVLLIGVAGLVTYIQSATFDVLQKPVKATSFAEMVQDDLLYTDKGFEVLVPDEVIGTEVGQQMSLKLTDSPYTLNTIFYDGSNRSFLMNLSHSGFYLPLSITTQFEQSDSKINLKIQSIHIGKNKMKLFWPLDKFVQGLLPVSVFETIQLDPMTVALNKGVYYDEGQFDETGIRLYYKMDSELIDEFYQLLKSKADKDLIQTYKDSDDLGAQKAGDLMSQVYPLTDEQLVEVINDLRTSRVLINHLLVLAGEETTSKLAKSLSIYGITIDESQIIQDRKILEGQKWDSLFVEILNDLEAYFSDGFIAFNLGKPFDVVKHETITLKDVVKLNKLNIDKTLLSRLSFVKKDGVGVAYQLDDQTYYIRYIDSYEMQNSIEFAKYEGATTYKAPELVDDLTLWNEIEERLKVYFGVENIFVRYMKSDGESTFVIASPEDDPQQYWKFAILRDESNALEILDDNVKTVMGLHEAHPEFNIETVTYEIERVKLIAVTEETYDTILSQLYGNGLIGSPSEYEIVYASSNSNYIAFLLNNGEQYVYKVDRSSFGTYLQTVYKKDKAITNWPDMPTMILLQDKPQE